MMVRQGSSVRLQACMLQDVANAVQTYMDSVVQAPCIEVFIVLADRRIALPTKCVRPCSPREKETTIQTGSGLQNADIDAPLVCGY